MTKCALIVIGTELTRGIIADKHGVLVSREMTHIGVHVSEIVAVPDDGSVTGILKAIKKNNDIIIVTGGLGPTQDDITRRCIAEAFNTTLVRNEDCIRELKKRVGDERLSGANEKQAYIPDGFTVMPNPNGTAPGFYGSDEEAFCFALPGPPREMEPMFISCVIPKVKEILGLREAERHEYTSFITAEALLGELTSQYPEIEWGTRFQDYQISLYASTDDKKALDSAVRELKLKLGPYRIVEGSTTALDILIDTLKLHNARISAAESCTGGLLSEILTERAGSSEFFLGSVVSYSNEMKTDALDVKEETVKRHGAVSEECAIQMAEGALLLAKSDYAVSITGVAGPDRSEEKDVGTVSFGFASKERKSEAFTLRFTSWGRSSVRRKAAVTALLFLSAYIRGEDIKSLAGKWSNI